MMKNIIEKHLETITVDNLMNFKAGTFIRYAGIGGIELGVNTDSQFIVKTTGEKFTFDNPKSAIEKYTELIQE